MVPVTFGSLFAGIGGIDLGLERCGMQCKWQVEIDDYATRILERHWPDVHRERDIRQCGRHNLQRVDVIAGGFPCQDISYAGKGAGLDGERSGLFFEAVRLVCELRPRAVVLENVAGLLTRGLDRVLGTLAEIGFDAEWHCIPAAAVGAPHIRDRVFILAYAEGERHWQRRESRDVCETERRPDDELFRKSSGTGEGTPNVANTWSVERIERCWLELQRGRKKETKQAGLGRSNVADANSAGRKRTGPAQSAKRDNDSQPVGCSEDVSNPNSDRSEAGISKQKQRKKRDTEKPDDNRSGWSFQSDWWATEPNVGRVANGVSNRVDRLRGLGNAVVPQVAEVAGRILLERIGGEDDLLRN